MNAPLKIQKCGTYAMEPAQVAAAQAPQIHRGDGFAANEGRRLAY